MQGGMAWLESLLEQQGSTILTAGGVTAGEEPVTPESDPDVTSGRRTARRRYKPRTRRCQCCKQPFTPKANKSAIYCSDRCRKKANRAKMAKQRKTESKAKEQPHELCTCLWCGATFFADPTRHPKYCTPSHKTAAYRQRRISAVAAVAVIRGIALEKVTEAIQRDGMKRASRFLKQRGYSYDESARAWLMAVPVGDVFVQNGVER